MVLEKIKAILSEQFSVEESEITAETLLEDDLGADSLDVVDLLMTIEDDFEVEIPDEEHQNRRGAGGVHREPRQRLNPSAMSPRQSSCPGFFVCAFRRALPKKEEFI